jgi:DNA polymerase III subunit alpha
MKVVKITQATAPKLVDGTLPDIDTDFTSKDRGRIKEYIEQRFGESQVCSVGTFTTMKVKGLVKDLSRTASVDFNEANLMTSIVEMGDKTMLDLIKRASNEPRLKNFIKQNSDLFYALPALLNQPKTQSIHPCAMIIFPSVMSATEWSPMRTQQGQIVSEWSGGEMDSAGFLKEDILGIKQLDKFTDIFNLIEANGGTVPDIFNLPEDPEVYRYFSNGWNGDVFQMKSAGLVEYSKALKPQVIGDLIAAVALYRPGPMQNGYHEIYVKCKNEGRQPTYLWRTEEITKDTFGLLVYQEQVMEVCKQLGGLDMKEADDVRRAMGKTKMEVLIPWKERVGKGFEERGCPRDEFEHIWNVMLEFSKYSYNLSHSAVYAITAYACQYLKVHFPIEYWTVALDYASEADSLNYLSEILAAKKISVKPPDINHSDISMLSNQAASTIFWGIGSIKGIGEDTAIQIIKERKKNGPYKSFADFYFRSIFKGSKVKKQTFEALIASGAFDELYNFEGSESRRMMLISRYRKFTKKKIANPQRDPYTIGETSESWWWKKQQKTLTGLSFIDYQKIAEEQEVLSQFCLTREFTMKQDRGIFRAFGGYVVEVRHGKSAKGKYARITVEHNYKLFKLLIWSEEYSRLEEEIKRCEKSLIVFTGELRYDAKFAKANQFTLKENSQLIVL